VKEILEEAMKLRTMLWHAYFFAADPYQRKRFAAAYMHQAEVEEEVLAVISAQREHRKAVVSSE